MGLAARASREQLNCNPPTTLQSLPSRARANSDTPLPVERSRLARKPPAAIHTTTQSHARKSSLEVTFKDGPPNDSVDAGLALLRHSILTSRVDATKEGMSDYRIYLWLALLNIPPIPTDDYLALVNRGRSPAYEKISNDVFRTLATDTLFKRRVTDASLTRVLNATAWRLHDAQKAKETPLQRTVSPTKSKSPHPSESDSSPSFYIQGMNVLTAPLLYASRSETQAYALLTCLLTTHIPSYVAPSLPGVYAGLALVDRILALINPTLSAHLLSKNLHAKIYAFPSVLTLCACTPPLPEVLRLWDFLFAFGTGLNVVAIVAQLLLLKDRLMESASPMKILRTFPAMDSEQVIKMTLWIVGQIPEDLYEEVIRHGYAE